MYPRPGGDIDTWKQVVLEFGVVRTRYPGVRIILAGDGNVHLSYLAANHPRGCSCLHCYQKRGDKDIEAALLAADLWAFNPHVATHASGTTIDLTLSSIHEPLEVHVCIDDIRQSDHGLIWTQCDVSLALSRNPAVGRVMWAQPGLWEHVFEHASNVFAVLSLAAELATEEISDTRSLTSKRRRAILDAAAWARDAVICLLGHCFNLVAASYTSLAGSKSGNLAWPRSLPFPEDFDDYEDYKCAMTDFNSGVRSAMYQKFLSLRSASPSEASKFLSACFRKDKNFEVALTDEESGHLLSIQQALGALESDYHARVEVNLSHDHPTNEKIKESVRSISRARAPATGINGLPALPSTTTADNPQPYSLSELELALTGIQTKKVCIHGPLAAVKADAGQSRRLTLALVNLGRAAEETATSWSTRCISPIRKSGPKVVRKIACLRPISLTADLASVQDALWLGRCKHLLEVFSGHRQMGGKLDTVAVILAIVLHVQIRAFQGLYSYLLFADIKHAYDTADHDGMLLASYLAGIVEVEWRLLQDFLAMDSAVVALGGCISGAFHLRAGIPQGREFSVHVFTALMRFLADILTSECNPAIPKLCF